MSIERLGGAYSPVCDCCGEELATEYDFYDALAAVRAAGWRNVKCGSEWMTYCPDCYNEIHGAAADFTGVGR